MIIKFFKLTTMMIAIILSFSTAYAQIFSLEEIEKKFGLDTYGSKNAKMIDAKVGTSISGGGELYIYETEKKMRKALETNKWLIQFNPNRFCPFSNVLLLDIQKSVCDVIQASINKVGKQHSTVQNSGIDQNVIKLLEEDLELASGYEIETKLIKCIIKNIGKFPVSLKNLMVDKNKSLFNLINDEDTPDKIFNDYADFKFDICEKI